MPRLTLERFLQSQGWGSRRECRELIGSGRLQVPSLADLSHEAMVEGEGLSYIMDGVAWRGREKLLIALHKPAGYECSRQSTHHLPVFDLLPLPFSVRGLQTVGRLDQDTTGLLLLTDDGPLLHRLTSPKHHVAKTYLATCADPVTPDLVEALLTGVELRGDGVVRAVACRALDSHRVELVLGQGLYHQVKRMLAAAGNHCLALERTAFGQLELAALGLEPGHWCLVEPAWLEAGAPA